MNLNSTGSIGQARLKDVEIMDRNKFKQIVLNLFDRKYILIYVVAFMLSTVSNSFGENMFFRFILFCSCV